ncbi:hypothetical protein M5X00_20980 [Paenibacillus alvei]|uniref:hypothetical protein n=2 Tax=Paenibacillus alvei TaxID=44250 RepID=UPI002281D8E8|nr:hypothetical protein [Paenibacillus alvei]MCY9756718.1 hypothetical protein [Paenibacillus alvei]
MKNIHVMEGLGMKKKMFTVFLAFLVFAAVPFTAFASGAMVERITNSAGYKAAQTWFKMPDSMYVAPDTYPSVFWTFDTVAPNGTYYNLDFGLQYANGGWRFQYFGGASQGGVARSGTAFNTWSSSYGSNSCPIGSPCASTTYGHSPTVLSYQPGQTIRLDVNFVTLYGANAGAGVQVDIYNASNSLLAQAVIPIEQGFKDGAETKGARFNRQFNMVTTAHHPDQYKNNGSYAYNAKFLDASLVTTSGSWVSMTQYNSSAIVKFEGFDSMSTDGKIFHWSELVSGYVHDNIGYSFR